MISGTASGARKGGSVKRSGSQRGGSEAE